MGYKDNTVVISIPVTHEDNEKLYSIARDKGYKSKTSLASELLKEAISDEFQKLENDISK
jgi:hypothetical protein